ncbi:TPA: transposase [Salmonella enterica]|nr:transposase [Salmonella enterica]
MEGIHLLYLEINKIFSLSCQPICNSALKSNFSTNLYFIPAYSPELNRIEMVWKQMKYYWRDFQVMTADKIEQWVERVSNQFGKEYMFTF